MATEVYLVKELSRLGAADPISADLLQSIRQGEQVKAIITRPRHPAHHKKLFALLNLVLGAQQRYKNVNSLLLAVKRGAGYGEWIPFMDGEFFVADSISYANADQGKFEPFFNDAVNYILTDKHLLKGVKREDLDRQIEEILQGRAR